MKNRTFFLRVAFICFAVITVAASVTGGALFVRELLSPQVERAGQNVAVNNASYHNLTANFKHAVNRLRYSYAGLRKAVAVDAIGDFLAKDSRRAGLSSITVNSSASLVQALKSATSGDTILLDQGVYSGLNISKVNFAGGVTISSMDAARPAVITDLQISNSSGLSFQNIEFAMQQGLSNPYKVGSSSNIHFYNLYVHGSLNGDPGDDQPAFQVRSSSNVSIQNSEFEQVHIAITHLDNNGIKFSGNYIHDVRMDGIRGAGSSNVEISNNYFTNFYRYGSEHPDAIQFWTTNTTASQENIVITGNIFARGNGSAVQGIFMGNERDIPFVNVKVNNNVIIGSMYHGIHVEIAKGLEVVGNYVQGYSDFGAWIFLKNVNGAVMGWNQATRFKTDGSTDVSSPENVTLDITADSAAVVRAWLAQHPEAIPLLNGAALESLGLSAAPSVVVPQAPAAVAPAAIVAPTPGDVVTGGGTSEQIVVSKGNDTVYGGVGDDTVTGVSGSNYLRGEEGDDKILGGSGFDDINGNTGNDTAYGGLGDDWVVGGKDNDALAGEGGNDIVYGNLGTDTVDGGDGDDIVRGGQDNDWIDAGAGADWLAGDRGADTLIGGAGADVFHTFADAGMDRVLDFSRAQGDRVHLDPGTQYTVVQTGADVTIGMTGGGQMVLVGVQLSTLTGDWIFGA